MLLQSLFFRRFLAVCLFFSYHTATAQSKLELKTEVLGLAFDTQVEASLEYLLDERVGIEAGVGYDWDNGASPRFDSSLMLIYVDV